LTISPTNTDSLQKTVTVTVSAAQTTTTAAAGGAAGTANITTGKVTKIYSSILPFTPKLITAADLEASGTHLTELYIEVKNRVVSVSISIEQLPQKPADVTVDVSGKVYRYVKITKENLDDENIAQGKIKFKVEKSWINANNINVTTIALYRYTNGQWNRLATNKISEDSNYVFFEAATPGFSYFAISGEMLAAATTTTTVRTTTIPATTTTVQPAPSVISPTMTLIVFGIVLIIVAAIFFVLVGRKKAKTSGAS
jgi:PGF-pre-PGF domain-containing protein